MSWNLIDGFIRLPLGAYIDMPRRISQLTAVDMDRGWDRSRGPVVNDQQEQIKKRNHRERLFNDGFR